MRISDWSSDVCSSDLHSDAIPHGAARMRRITWIATLCCLAATAQAADVHLLTAAHIHTSDPEQPQAEAMAWDESGRLLAVGDAKTLQAQYPDAERIDAGQATVLPGLIDAHGHPIGLGHALEQADLEARKTSSRERVWQ